MDRMGKHEGVLMFGWLSKIRKHIIPERSKRKK